jgi:hypothetical protein
VANDDKRRFHRIPFEAKAQIFDEAGRFDCELLDVSLKGALLALPSGWSAEPGSEHRLVFTLEGSDTNITMQARLAHIEKGCAGFQCTSIDLDSITELKRLIELNLGDHQLLERELSQLGE